MPGKAARLLWGPRAESLPRTRALAPGRPPGWGAAPGGKGACWGHGRPARLPSSPAGRQGCRVRWPPTASLPPVRPLPAGGRCTWRPPAGGAPSRLSPLCGNWACLSPRHRGRPGCWAGPTPRGPTGALRALPAAHREVGCGGHPVKAGAEGLEAVNVGREVPRPVFGEHSSGRPQHPVGLEGLLQVPGQAAAVVDDGPELLHLRGQQRWAGRGRGAAAPRQESLTGRARGPCGAAPGGSRPCCASVPRVRVTDVHHGNEWTRREGQGRRWPGPRERRGPVCLGGVSSVAGGTL